MTLPSPAENLALDEALLEEAERGSQPAEVLRLWEPAATMVVVGRATKVDSEVHVATCRERQIPILRRSSGGAAIVTGPGCLMYALVLSHQRRPALRRIQEAHRLVLHLRDHAPKELRESAIEGVPLHLEISVAWEQSQDS